MVPKGLCILRILKEKSYEVVIGVDCGEEVKLGADALDSMKVAVKVIHLIKNGCANTALNMET